MLQRSGYFRYDGITWRRQPDSTPAVIHVRADIDRTEMWLQPFSGLWLVRKMLHNPLGIDWEIGEE